MFEFITVIIWPCSEIPQTPDGDAVGGGVVKRRRPPRDLEQSVPRN